MQETRRFDGETYRLAVYYKSKFNADRCAKRFRKGQYLHGMRSLKGIKEKARVVKCDGQWCVYTRKK